MERDEQAVRALHDAWIGAVNAGDLTRLLDLMTEDAVFLTPGQAPSGRDGFATNFSDAQQRVRVNCTSELDEVVVVGTVAYAWSRDALSVSPRTGGDEMRLAGHRLTVYRKESDGKWRLAARRAHAAASRATRMRRWARTSSYSPPGSPAFRGSPYSPSGSRSHGSCAAPGWCSAGRSR